MTDNGTPGVTYHLHGRQCVDTGKDMDGNPVVVATYADGHVLVMHPEGIPYRAAMVLDRDGIVLAAGTPTKILPYGGRASGYPNTSVIIAPIIIVPIGGYLSGGRR